MFSFAVVGAVAEDFETVGIRLRSGRTFGRNDRRGGAPVAIVSEQAARLLGIEGGAVGRRGTSGRFAWGVADHCRRCSGNEVSRVP